MAHGAIGGVPAVTQGDKFGHGFLRAGITQIASQGKFMPDVGANGASDRIKNALAVKVVGGITSEISGGKFANGAMTGVFSRSLNDLVIDLNKYLSVSYDGKNLSFKVYKICIDIIRQ